VRRSLGLIGALVVLASAMLALTGAPVAAQGGCLTDDETADQPSLGTMHTGELCLDGMLAEGDQDLLAWEVRPEDVRTRWTFHLTGVEDALSSFDVLRVTSEPGIEPPTLDTSPVLKLGTGPDVREAAPREDVLLSPGRYVLAVYRSNPQGFVAEPALDYHISITRGADLPPDIETEPNDTADVGTSVTGAFAGSGDLASSDDHLRWTADTSDPAALWQVSLQVPVGRGVWMTLTTADGTAWITVMATAGATVVHDLVPDPAGYDIKLAYLDDDPLPYDISASAEPADGPSADPEPNDQVDRALAIDPARPLARGRLATVSDVDVWRLTVDQAEAERQMDIRLLAPAGPSRQLCLSDAVDTWRQCASGSGGLVLSNLLLAAGDYLLRVSGDADPQAPYVIRVDPTSIPVADYETEPNDVPTMATPFDASVVMRGRAEGGETDMYLLNVIGEPQLWQVEARGAGIGSLLWIDGGGYAMGYGVVADDHATATLYDLYLVPGEHRISIQADGGDYTLTATPMGPPDPNAEREPNDELARANRLEVGDTRTGRLRALDTDWYRFSLAAMEHVAIDVDVPDPSAIVMELEVSGQTIVETRGTAVGQDIRYDALLPAGDYVLWLRASEASDQAYRLGLERGDPFTRTGDLEPDDSASVARDIPDSGVIEGTGWGGSDPDWFRLGALDGSPLRVEVGGDLAFLELVQGDSRVSLRQDGDGPTWATDEVVAGDGYLVATGLGDYTLRLPGAAASPPPARLDVELVLPTDALAAWWPTGQHIDAMARITNRSAGPTTASLESWTSHYLWTATLGEVSLSLEPGATVEVPLAIDIRSDPWADTPVAIGVRATDGADDAFGWATVTPTGDAVPMGARQAWDLPDALVGGLDVASVALGGVSDGAIDPAGELLLHDGAAIGGGTMTLPVTDPVTATTVDLAGDDPVPVAGIVIDPASGLDSLSQKPRGFELSLSEDGVDWTSVLTGEATPLGIDQAFVLPEPVPARFARLAVTSTWAVSLLGWDPATLGPQSALLAEWKVIATPGTDPAATPRDIADPTLGGHVATSDPLFSELPYVVSGVLDEDPTAAWVYPPGGGDITWVVGFLNDRAAQVTQLGWQDPASSDPAIRARRVTVEVGTVSPLGPWRPVGTWELDRAADGTIAPFVFDTPTWVRYLRFTARGPRTKGTAWELPGRISVLERPTDDTYRSILAEWGQSRPVGPYELLEPADAGQELDDPDVGEGSDAIPLAAEVSARGRVAIGTDADEYRIDVPEGQHSIRFEVTGRPVVGVRLRLFGPDDADVPLAFVTAGTSGGDAYQANVTPGTSYRVRVEQPPFSAVLMYDTSLSIASYWRPITQGLMAFAADVRRGRDRVMVIPFGADARPLLRDWTDDAYLLLSALEGNFADGDSSTEASVLHALKVLTARQGARAILLVTDGETSSFGDGARMWAGLAGQRPLIYTVHLGGTPGTTDSTHLLQDLAGSSGGAYAYVRTQDELDRAFDAMATTLRRPAGYTLAYTTSAEDLPPPEPGALSVVTRTGADGTPVAAPIDSSVAIEIVLDTSSSMRAKLGRTTRIDAAKDVLTRLVREELPPGVPVALRWFRQAKGSCDTELAVPLGPLDPEAMASTIDGIHLRTSVRTPLAAAIEAVAGDLASVTGPRIVVVVSDGQESCKGDPEAAVRALRAQGVDVTINVVGIGLSKEDRKRIRRLATLGGGSYFDARGAGQLDDAIRGAVSAPYEVRDASGTIVGRGIVNGPALELPPGTYRVTVLTEPPYEFEAVVLESGSGATLTLPDAVPTP
jgi:Mg-chelatase subunit ChlD